MKEYLQFRKALIKEIDTPMAFREQIYEHFKNEINIDRESYKKFSAQRTYLSKKTFEYINQAKIFMVNNDVSNLLSLTNNEITNRKLPFDYFFINSSFNLDDNNKIEGILIFKKVVNNKTLGGALGCARVSHKGTPSAFVYFDLFSKKLEHSDLDNPLCSQDGAIGKFKDKKVQVFIMNFLDFLNNPEVEIIEVDRTKELNTIRIGNLPTSPQQIFVRVNGKLKIYLNELQSGGHFHYSHSFWVRGHFRTLRSERRYKDKVGIKMWILPYIKGKGILINKIYEVKKKAAGENTLPSAGANALV